MENEMHAMEAVLGHIDLLALILACLPMSKHKLHLQLVSKTWKSALETPAAHSSKTEDHFIPIFGKGMSEKVTRVLSQCRSRCDYPAGRIVVFEDGPLNEWLNPDLQKLDLFFDQLIPYDHVQHVLESLPVMARLGHLKLIVPSELYRFDLSRKFPGLKDLFWRPDDGEGCPIDLRPLYLSSTYV